MIKLTPILLALAYGLLVYLFSAWRSRQLLSARSARLSDPALGAIAARLARALDLPRVEVHLFETSAINGFAAPDGRVFLTRGLYDRFRAGEVTGEEIASVIAHELGHVALGHSKRRMIDVTGQGALRTALLFILPPPLRLIGAHLVNALSSLVLLRFSRKAEYEADAYAAALLVKSGIGTGPQKALFRKLPRLVGARAAYIPDWLLSHPKTEDRIRAIEALEARWAQAVLPVE